jgi:uncharacterized coiled-coil DUF342 family protein
MSRPTRPIDKETISELKAHTQELIATAKELRDTAQVLRDQGEKTLAEAKHLQRKARLLIRRRPKPL